APGGAAVTASHEPGPANGFTGMPSTSTFTSLRAQARRTTPSGDVVGFAPLAAAIASASSLGTAGCGSAKTNHPAAAMSATDAALSMNRLLRLRIAVSLKLARYSMKRTIEVPDPSTQTMCRAIALLATNLHDGL